MYDLRTATYRAPAGMAAADAEQLARRAVGSRPVRVSMGSWEDPDTGTQGALVTFIASAADGQAALDAAEAFADLLAARGQDPESFSTSLKESAANLAGGAVDLVESGLTGAAIGLLKRPAVLAVLAVVVAIGAWAIVRRMAK